MFMFFGVPSAAIGHKGPGWGGVGCGGPGGVGWGGVGGVRGWDSKRIDMIPYYRSSISCFCIDIDLILKILKQILHRSSGFFGTDLFHVLKWFDFQSIDISQT